MGYSVYYSPQTEKKFPSKRTKHKKSRIIVKIILIVCLIVFAFSLSECNLLYELFIPGKPAVTVAAMESLAYNLREGMPLVTAVETFCVEIFSSVPLT